MANTPSNMMPLLTKAPDFVLFDTVSKTKLSLQGLRGTKATVILFICNHCPFVIHVNSELVRLANDYKTRGVSVIAISSNDVDHYPQDGPEKMTEVANALNYPFPYLFDETQIVAKVYEAACTPDSYVFDENLKLAYRGQIDDSRPGNGIEVSGEDIRSALNNIIAGESVSPLQKPSIGCNIKWK